MKRLVIRNLRFHSIGPVNLDVAEAECVGVSGPSGAGKTLFLRAIADMDRHSGQIFLNGVESTQMPAPEWRKKVGLLPAESAWWYDTVGEHFCRIDEAGLNALGFDKTVLKWEVRRLSSGERQRLSLLRLIAGRPQVLLLDEPTANLDADTVKRVEKFLLAYRLDNRVAVIWVSHDFDQLARVSSRRFLIHDQRMIEFDLTSSTFSTTSNTRHA